MQHFHARYRNQTIADFIRQLLFTPKSKRPEQIARAEALHDLIEPQQNYPFDFINYRITGYHSETELDEATILVGEALLPDLRTAIEHLCLNSDTLPGNEPMTDLATLARELNVSTKTIHRWRDIGLRSRWYKPAGQKKMILGFTPSALATFDKRHPGKIKRATEREHMSDEDVLALLNQARDIAVNDSSLSLNQVAKQLSEQTGRALQTIRLQLQKHDQTHPDQAIFPDHHGPLTDRQARLIARLHRQGQSANDLAKTYGKTPSTIRRAILNSRLQVFKRLPIDPIKFQDSYTDPAKIRRFRHFKIRETDWQTLDTHASSDLPILLYAWFATMQLKPAAKLQAFEQYHFLRYAAKQGIDELQFNTCTASQINAIEADIRSAGKLKDQLATCSLPVVMAVARRHMDHLDEQSVYMLQDLLILGCQILFGELDLFDPFRKHEFDTFISWRLQRSFATWLSDQHRAKRAIKRMTPEEVIHRIRTQAMAFGIKLPVFIESS